MAYDTKSLETLKRQFHSRSVTFNNFKDITSEEIETLKKIIANKKKSDTNKTYYNNSGLNNYINTLRYLTNPTISQELSTFDKKILYLILTCDPDLITIKTFICSDIIPFSDITEEENEKKRKELESIRRNQINEFESEVRKKIGFYDSNLLKYESILNRGLLRKREFESNIRIPSLKKLLNRTELIKNLDSITDESLIKLRTIKELWLKEAKDPQDLNSLAYNLLYKYKELHLYTIEEQIITFILIADSELDLLKIFEEESTFKNIKERANEELGFFNKSLINVERLYHKKFEPKRKLSAWTI